MSVEQYAATREVPTIGADNAQLEQVADLYAQAKAQEAVVAQLQADLKAATLRLSKIREEALPAVLDELGLTMVGTDDGKTITLKSTLYASVPKKNKGEVAQWLEDHGHGSLVKKSVGVAFPKGEQAKANEAVKALSEAGITGISISEDINTTSLKSLISELLAQGEDVPLKLMGAYIKREAVIK